MKQKFDVFIGAFDDPFEAADAVTTMRNEEDKEFLEKQRQKGRPGSMLGIDMKLASKAERSKLRKETKEERKFPTMNSFAEVRSNRLTYVAIM